MTEELTKSEKNILRLIGESEGRFGLYRFHDRYVRHYHDSEDFLLISKLGKMGMLEGITESSTTDDYESVKLALSDKGKEYLCGTGSDL